MTPLERQAQIRANIYGSYNQPKVDPISKSEETQELGKKDEGQEGKKEEETKAEDTK